MTMRVEQYKPECDKAPDRKNPAERDVVIGKPCKTEKAPGHWVLARLGKRVLRPGGIELTRRMLSSLQIGEYDDVVEFAPGLGATARMTLGKRPRSYIAVERDPKAADTVARLLTGPCQRCVLGRAETTGLTDACASVVYGEAMLTMQTQAVKHRIVTEAGRLLRSGGRYAIHEIAVAMNANANEIGRDLSGAIHHSVLPLTVEGWRTLFESAGLKVIAEHRAPMHLLEPRRMIADEGIPGAIRFAFNLIRDRESRRRVGAMRRVFRKHERDLMAIALVATKP